LLAAATGDVKIMKLLLAKGADPLLTTDDGTTPLMAAAGISRSEDRTKEEEKNALDALKLTVEMGGDVNATNKNGFTAMHGAAYTGANEIIQFLAGRGAKLNVMNKFGETPLSIAAGDPNGLVGAGNGASQPVHESTEALLRNLISDHTLPLNVAQDLDISSTKPSH
jgi:ankyrin repeat protein